MPETLPAKKFIAIATSTGGSIYLHEIFHHLPADLPAAVLICHSAPQSLTKRIVQNMPGRYEKKLPLPISFGMEAEIILSSNIYLCPLSNDMVIEAIEGGYRLRLAPPTGNGGPNLDRFLHSIAQNAAPRSIGITLSGETLDGAEGLRALRAQGGKTISIQPDQWTACPQLPQFIQSERIAEKIVNAKNLSNQILQSLSQIRD